MKLTEFEKQLYDHAERVKIAIEAPFGIETEKITMTTSKFKIKKTLLLTAAIICIIGTSVFAAIHFLSPDNIAQSIGDTKLSEAFKNTDYPPKTITDGKYSATLLGIVSGENISDFESSAWDIIPERTYAVVAVERTDKTPMTFDEPIMITPLIQGLKPWQYNIASMHGSYTSEITDGILYRIIEMDSIECFADQTIYMAVTDTAFISNEQFSIDAESGVIAPEKEYFGTNILFELKVDKSKADSDKARQYLIELKDELSSENEIPDTAEKDKKVSTNPGFAEDVILEKSE